MDKNKYLKLHRSLMKTPKILIRILAILTKPLNTFIYFIGSKTMDDFDETVKHKKISLKKHVQKENFKKNYIEKFGESFDKEALKERDKSIKLTDEIRGAIQYLEQKILDDKSEISRLKKLIEETEGMAKNRALRKALKADKTINEFNKKIKTHEDEINLSKTRLQKIEVLLEKAVDITNLHKEFTNMNNLETFLQEIDRK